MTLGPAQAVVDDKLHLAAEDSIHADQSQYVTAAVRKNLSKAGKFAPVGTVLSVDEAKEKGLKLVDPANPPPNGDAPRSPSPSRLRPAAASPSGTSPGGGSPLAYLRLKPGKSAKGKAAKSKAKAKPSRPSPKRRGGGGGAHGVGAGAKRKADGSVSKKEELRVEALQIYDDLTAGISAVKSRFEQERCDKDLLTAMLTKCNRALAYFTNPKHMDLERAPPLQNIHKDVTAMKSFVIASS